MTGKVLLVDDEAHITRNLEKVIPWEMLGLTIAGTAKNGAEALELMERVPVQLVLCDIRMPVMDGLELVRHIREKGWACDIIMLSGYQDFAYTRAAIQFGVNDYVLKPIPYDELTGVIARVMAGQRNKRKQEQEERHKLGKMIHLASEKILYDILMDYSDFSTSQWLLSEDEQLLKQQQYVLISFDLDVSAEDSRDWREWSDKERKLWNFAVCNVLREQLRKLGLQHAVIQMRDGEWCVLIGGMQEGAFDGEQAKHWAEALLHAVGGHVKLGLQAGIYKRLVGLENLADAYRKVQQGAQLSPERGSIAFYPAARNEESGGGEQEQAFWIDADKLIRAIKRGDTEAAREWSEHIAERLGQLQGQSSGRIKTLLHFFVLQMMREMKEMAMLTKEQEEHLWRRLDHRFGIKELLSIIEQVAAAVAERSGEKKKQSEIAMERVRLYLDNHIYRDIALEEVASHAGLSTSYFSLLFKQTFGATFIEYVTRSRMERARQLLSETQLSVAQIARELGYAERRYFTKVFLKYTGDNPSDYRSKIREAQGLGET